jgi:FAD dependent oxidoreductase
MGGASRLRHLKEERQIADVVVVGGGLAGVSCAVTAARQGLRVALVQDRPVLGGNASSEVRLWVLGATSHMGNNNRWAREGGVIDEILVENMWRNPEGNPVLFDSILLELVVLQPSISLLLNTAVHELEISDNSVIQSVKAFCSQNQTLYTLEAPLFVDASGDGIVGFLSGAEFRIGAESAAEFNEKLAGEEPTQELLGHSLYFYTRDTGRPVKYVPPAFALQDITTIPRFRELRVSDTGCRLWWLEYGGNMDTIYETEEIKWELWRVAYGVWNYIKNSGEFPDSANLTLEWMGMIPGKRESRRFVGDMVLTQNDVVNQITHPDAVSFGGWAIDLHPAAGVFSPQPGCTQWHSKGVYQIPYRTMYSRNVPNLFLTGRLISASHIAFGSTRVMATCAHNGQAVGVAAALCREQNLSPRDLTDPAQMHRLQQTLLRTGQHIPGIAGDDQLDLAKTARVSASSTLRVSDLSTSGELANPDVPHALLVPLAAGRVPAFTLLVDANVYTVQRGELWRSSRPGNATPDILLASLEMTVPAGRAQQVIFDFSTSLEEPLHVFFVLPVNPDLALYQSRVEMPGILSLSQKMNSAVAKSAIQTPPPGSGVDTFSFWLPERRPTARNLAVRFTPPLEPYSATNILNGFTRPWHGANAWVPDLADPKPTLHLSWDKAVTIQSVEIVFDTDTDHPMESVLLSHPERIMPGCITAFRLVADYGQTLAEIPDNHQTRRIVNLAKPVNLSHLSIEVLAHGDAPPAIFEVRCY